MKYAIYDWMGARCLTQDTFNTFDDAWAFIMEHVENDEDLQEYSVEPVRKYEFGDRMLHIEVSA